MDFTGMMPLAKTLGVTIDESTTNRVAGKLPIRPDICTAGDIVHGGAIMGFADCLGAVGAYLTLPEGASGTTTIESKTNFLGAGPVGAVLIGEATPVKAGKRLSVWQTRIRTEDGIDVALVTQTQLVLLASLSAEAIVCAVRAHGEHGAILRALTHEAGLVAGYVRGGRSRRVRPILVPGNLVALELRARTEDQLAGATAELLTSRAPLLAEPLPAAAIDWATSVTAAVLPESQPYPALYAALSAVLDAIEVAPSARQWAAALARYELLLLGELGFGLNLEECVATGARGDLAFVSPKSGGAISVGAASGYEARLFRLPPFLHGIDGEPTLDDVLDALAITGHFLDRDLLEGRNRDLLSVRERLVGRLKRAVA